jgi:hypothetical protein
MARFTQIVNVVVDTGRGAVGSMLLAYFVAIVLSFLGIVRDNDYDGYVAVAGIAVFGWLGGSLAFWASLSREVLRTRNGG